MEADVLKRGDQPNVLVVEDDPVSALLVKRLLAAQEIACDHALNGKQALEMHSQRPYRLVVSDWMMPEMTGIELCQAFRRAEGSYVYFVLCSAKGERADRQEAFESGVDDFLSKPLDRDELVFRLKVARRILSSEDKLTLQKAELERASETLRTMNANLEMASRRFEELFNGLPVACFTFDEAGLLHEWNRAAEEKFAIEPGSAFQSPIWKIIPTVSNDLWTGEMVKKIFRENGMPPTDWSYTTPEGEYRAFACTVFTLKDESGRPIGAISANLDITDRQRARQQIEEQMRQINEFAGQLEVQKHALEEANQLLALRADTDGLTGLLNHRRFHTDFERAFEEARRDDRALSVILLDVDHFKTYNDSYGHQAGDEVLQAFASLLKATSRRNEILGRYGGEEFAMVLQGCARAPSVTSAERFRVAIEGYEWGDRPVTASFGVATLNPKASSARELLRWADEALYAAKAAGRNRVVHFDDIVVQAAEESAA
ncbi:MAG: diguanylate cyclase [Fimbriimonas ginsengisoli]|uniref:Diguanylate cyclase n=1 Tax=Fimbriimonas ginsengisoli TaxID=1005039 RepID=A0A931LRS8_FIMGI|nr:diguanylate cyclase [Fimbriimonas ginsengisoli]